MLFGEQIRQIRLERGFTLEQVASVAGIDISTLSKFECEKHKVSKETYDEIFRALKLQTITEDDYRYPNIIKHRKKRKELSRISLAEVKRGIKSHHDHAQMLLDLKIEEQEAKNADYQLDRKRKIQAIKEQAQAK